MRLVQAAVVMTVVTVRRRIGIMVMLVLPVVVVALAAP